MNNFRVGYGYDAHRFAPDRKLILGGVDVPYVQGLDGHSDADVLVHAVCDALLGSLALGDIGQHFPDTDPTYKGIDSLILLKKTGELIASHGYRIGNLDVTLRLQKPKIAAYVPQMQQNLAKALDVEPEQISVKATTTERMGFEGSGEGASASAVALVYRNR
ncbi:MAG: 2-C-methyl-D-erythritol 2,4-cyclodiphosphate synthase [Bacteroides sp.]|nr:2-C-methyl-D-erythritol 2,4-cyclodiphosphate synthase [Ruminococcus flavefaciens]MCM1554140.1 2-C-methyl-D-erythritol 2,4-cyclodiphosphate synthase [Bacteroides sp.]